MNSKAKNILSSLKLMQQEGILTDFTIENNSESIKVFVITFELIFYNL